MNDIVAQFKYVSRRHVNLNRVASICKGDREVARAVAIRALRELADELEREGEPSSSGTQLVKFRL